MHPADIRALLKKAGYTDQSLGKLLRTRDDKVTIITHVVKGRVRSRQAESAISQVTGIAPQILWPQWYPTVDLDATT